MTTDKRKEDQRKASKVVRDRKKSEIRELIDIIKKLLKDKL